MTKIYLKRDYGNGEGYVSLDVEDRKVDSLYVGLLENRTGTCDKCHKKLDIVCSKTFSQTFCPFCRDTELVKINKAWEKENKKTRSKPSIGIPSWRLDLDEATPEQVLNRSQDDFKVPLKSQEQWTEFYNQPHELAKQRAAAKQRNEEALETLKSLG